MSKKPTTTRKASAKQEKYVATSLSGRVVSNSGATPFSKGDVTAVINEQEFIIECKTKMKESLSIIIDGKSFIYLSENDKKWLP